MTPYKPRETFSVAIIVGLYVFGMYLSEHVLELDSYREDHHYEELEPTAAGHTVETDTAEVIESDYSDTVGTDVDNLYLEKVDSAIAEEVVTESVLEESYFENLISNYENKIMSQLSAGESRTDVVVRYYKREIDSGKVVALSKYGYYHLHERPVSENLDQQESNSLFYGDSVSTEDIQLIAYILIQNGLPIKQIVPSKFHDGWKSRSVEIGTNLEIRDQKILSEEAIRSFRNTYYEQLLSE